MTLPQISIVMANWNGEVFLREGLASLLESASQAAISFELIVVDDASDDGSTSLIRNEFPKVRLIENERNVGFAQTCNNGAQAAGGRILVMVNNDVAAPVDFISRLVAPFFEPLAPDASPLFAVGAKTVEWDGRAANHLCMDAAWRRGAIDKVYSDPDELTPTTFIQGGAAAYNRSLFLALGGFDDLFAPGYWEDYDLSYRAAKAGWRLLYEPRALLRHLGQGSMRRRFGSGRLKRISERNRLWFNWLNIQSPRLLLRHILYLPADYAVDILSLKGFNRPGGFLHALWGMPRLLKARQCRRKDPQAVRSDNQLVRARNRM